MALRFQSKTCISRPLTRSQQLIWTGQRLQPAEPLYNMAIAFTLEGRVDEELFQQAFQQVVNASEAMRTSFEHHGGVARQRFHEQYLYDVEIKDFSEQDRAYVSQWLARRTTITFDLERCLFDSVLIKLGENRYVWYFNQHHLVTDASSTALVYRAVAREYSRLHSGDAANAIAFPTYSDYVDYEQERQNAKSTRRAQRYWQQLPKQQVEPSSFYCELPTERSGVTLRTPCELGVERIAELQALAQSDACRALTTDLAQFQVFATALFAWLYRVTGNHTLAFSMPTHNRALASHKQTPGLFIELYPLVVEVDDDDTFLTLYRKVASQVQQLLMHTGPGVSSFAINRDVQVVLNYITAEFGSFGDIPSSSEWVHPDSGDRNHLVRVQVEAFDGLDNLRVYFDLNEQAFPTSQRDAACHHFRALLDAFTQCPEQAIATAPLLDSSDTTMLASGVPSLNTPVTALENVVRAFLDQVERTPGAIALRCGDETRTYQQLNTLAQSFARKLSSEGVGSGDRVAVVLPRSEEAVVAIFGTLMIGAAYVPVDTEYPATRRDYIIANARAKVVVSNDPSRLSEVDHVRVVPVNLDPAGSLSSEISDFPIEPDHSAYLIYTSGSTGQPKGVDVAHGSLANYIRWARSYYQPQGPLVWPLFSSLAFDLTVTSLFVPLCSGGTLVIYPESDDQHDITVRRVIEDNQVDILKLTPAHLALLQAMDLSSSNVSALVVGGEDFRSELARSVSNYFGGRVSLYNEYGPTEGTVACAVHQFDIDRDHFVSVPIGQAVNGACLYVLNHCGELQPPGVVGELYIGGVGVAKGYFDNDELTSERFVENPFRPGEMMYRTGDLVRLRLDSEGRANGLMCLGRVDQQLKINGLRVEPGEIEQALLKHDAIDEAVVTLYTPQSDGVDGEEAFCQRCGISSRHPSAQLDSEHVCAVCHIYAAEAQRARDYFGDRSDLERIVEEIHADSASREEGAPDCMMLLSGGKDSTYALCQVVDLGLKPLVFTLDNGFISQGAKDNMERVTRHLGVELISGSTPAMNAIFRDSLNRFSNVCNGCFKTIYTLSLKIAQERGIKHIFTGLSRGQIFETRVADLFRQGEFDIERIDAMIIDARKAYHRADDAVSQLMDVSHFDDDRIFSDIQYVDYYRYTDVSLDTMLTYLKERVPWVRPADTGRSTNCLINEAGIYVHKQERGFHNYSLPYSWDVRLGHKERDAAREELDDNINIDNVNRILGEIDYTPRSRSSRQRRSVLVAHCVANAALDHEAVKAQLREWLPEGLVPAYLVEIESMPLTPNGKVDRQALPSPAASRAHLEVSYEPPSGQFETVLTEAWQDVFGMDRVGVNDNFFELGGDSIVNIQIVASVAKKGLLLAPQQVFDCPTIRELAAVAGTATELSAEQGPVVGNVALTPIQRRFFDWNLTYPERYCQHVIVRSAERLDPFALQEALRQLVVHHDVLRARFSPQDGTMGQEFGDPGAAMESLLTVEATLFDDAEPSINAQLDAQIKQIQSTMDLSEGHLFRAVLAHSSNDGSRLLLVAHHLIIDAVSWWVLLDDLEDGYRALTQGEAVVLPPKTSSMRHWADVYTEYGNNESTRAQLEHWRAAVSDLQALPLESNPDVNALAAAATMSSVDCTLDRRVTQKLLTEVSANWRVQPQDLMLTAITDAVLEWSSMHAVTLDIEAHGREHIADSVDVLRTTGWFTSVYPLRVERNDAGATESLRTIRDQLRQIKLGGTGFGALRYGDGPAASQLNASSSIPIVFNYLGLWRKHRRNQALFEFVQPLGASYGDGNRSPYIWEINAMVFDGQLRLTWDYAADRYTETTMKTLMSSVRQRLRELILHCADTTDERLSPQDFPNAGIDQGDLDDLLAEFGDL